MFNSTDARSYSTHNHPKTLQENKAPTDESIRLLNEFQEKIQENFIKSFRFEKDENNCIKGSVTLLRHPYGLKIVIVIQYELNGVLHQAQREIDEMDIKIITKPSALILLKKEIADAVADSLGVDPLIDYLKAYKIRKCSN